MGKAFSKLFSSFGFGKKSYKVIMIGLDAAGKTTALYKLKLNETVTTIPTIGFNVETVSHKNVEFTAWDIGGQERLRPLWRHYFQGCDAVIFLVDSADRERFEEAKKEIHGVMEADELSDAVLLVYANKADMPNAATAAELTKELSLGSLKTKMWYIQPSVATTGDGLYEGLDWLSNTLKEVHH